MKRRKTVSREELSKWVRENKSSKTIARYFKVSESTIKRRIRNYGLKGIRPKGRKPIIKPKQRFLEPESQWVPCVHKGKAEIEKIVFPRNWNGLTIEEQREWIKTYFMPKTKIPEPILQRNEKIEKGIIKLESGSKLKFYTKPVTISKRNPNLVREFEGWIGKWLMTVFHHKSMPHVKHLGVANPSRSKWIAQELSSEILSAFYAILLKIRWKYGFFKGKRRKKRKKSSISTLSLKNNNKVENSP